MNQQRPTTSNFRLTPGGMSNGPTRYGNQMSLPPPIPPRRQVNNYGSHFNMAPSYLGGYNNNYGYNSFSLRPSYNNYGNFNGPSGDVESRLIQYAEETSRPAFESIESIVTTFSSITMMLESTLFAMSSSFRAILAVADNIGKVRNMFGQILNTFILIKYAKKLYKFILFKLGLREDDPNTDLAWKKAFLDSVNDKKSPPTATTWPIFIFLSLIFVIPYLLHKIIKNINTNDIKEKTLQDWLQINEPVYSATVMYDFQAATSNELTIKCGQKIWLAPESLQPKNNPGWCKASNSINIGLVPSSYIQIVGEMKKKNNLNNENKNNDDDLNTTMEETFNNDDKEIDDSKKS